jgi:hypothetical protein
MAHGHSLLSHFFMSTQQQMDLIEPELGEDDLLDHTQEPVR